MNIKDVTSFFDKAKKTTQDASHALADKAVSAADKAQAAVVSAATSIKDNIQHKKDDEAKARKDKRDSMSCCFCWASTVSFLFSTRLSLPFSSCTVSKIRTSLRFSVSSMIL